MSDRQHYVFLQVGDVIQEGDEYLDVETDEWMCDSGNIGHVFKMVRCSTVRRPVPTAQPTETCKWKRDNCCIQNPHTLEWTCDAHKDCPTCGKRIEVMG